MSCDLEATQMRCQKNDSLPAFVRLHNPLFTFNAAHEFHELVLRSLPKPHHFEQHLAGLGRYGACLAGRMESCRMQIRHETLALDKRQGHDSEQSTQGLDDAEREGCNEPEEQAQPRTCPLEGPVVSRHKLAVSSGSHVERAGNRTLATGIVPEPDPNCGRQDTRSL